MKMSGFFDSSISQYNEKSPSSYSISFPTSSVLRHKEDTAVSAVRRGKIAKPICVPQMDYGFDMPFARGYAPALNDVGISQEVFIEFLDGLNAAMIASPPLQVVGLVGLVIGFVPFTPCAIASGAIQISAHIAIHILSKTLTDRHMRDANQRIFAPAGLRARLCKTPAMRALAKVPWTVAPGRPCFMKRVLCRNRKSKTNAPSPPPGTLVRSAPPIVDMNISGSVTRRMTPYEKYISPITFDVPPRNQPTSVIARMSDFAVNRRRSDLTKRAANETARRQLLAGVPVTRELTRSDRRVMKKLADGKEEQVRKAVSKSDKRESKRNEKFLWLIILTEEEDRFIHGSNRADDSKDEIVFTVDEIEKAQMDLNDEVHDIIDADPEKF